MLKRERKMENFIKSMISIEHLDERSRERERWRTLLRACSAVSISTNAQCVTQQNYFSHATLGYNFFPTLPIKLKLGLEVGNNQLIATHLDQSNYLANQKQGEVNLTVCTTRFQSSESCGIFQGFQWLRWILTDEPHPRIPVQGHKLSVGRDA